MKPSEFKKLIREEVRRVLKEANDTHNPIGLRFELNLLGTTSDGKNFTAPYKLQPDAKVKLSIIEDGDGNTVPSINFMTIFRNQLIGKDLGRINIAVDIPWGPVDKMGKDLLKLINQAFASDSVKTDRGNLTNAGDAKKLINSVVAQKWPLLNDKAINNPKALKMMYGMGAAIERIAAVQEGFRKGLKEGKVTKAELKTMKGTVGWIANEDTAYDIPDFWPSYIVSDIQVVSFDEGAKEVLEYAKDYGAGSEQIKEMAAKLKELKTMGNKFVLYGFEADLNLGVL